MQFSEYKKIVQPSEVHAFSFRTALAGRRVEESAHLTQHLSQDTAYQPTHLPSNSFFLVEPPGSPGRSLWLHVLLGPYQDFRTGSTSLAKSVRPRSATW